MSKQSDMTPVMFAIHVVAGLIAITILCAGIAAIATRKHAPVQHVEDDDAPRSETP